MAMCNIISFNFQFFVFFCNSLIVIVVVVAVSGCKNYCRTFAKMAKRRTFYLFTRPLFNIYAKQFLLLFFGTSINIGNTHTLNNFQVSEALKNVINIYL